MPDLYDNPVLLAHNHVRVALHQLRSNRTPTLLLLHGLGGHSPREAPQWADDWPGSVHALDFTGHGSSTRPRGGGYTAEILMADADIALARLGPCTVVGHGLGAYIALLLAGARPELVRGAILCDGPGLAGGPSSPMSPIILVADDSALIDGEPDPYALLELSHDVRPPDYAVSFARQALTLCETERPITVCARFQPPWLDAVASESGVARTTLEAALTYYARR